jgi:hypothetical protein
VLRMFVLLVSIMVNCALGSCRVLVLPQGCTSSTGQVLPAPDDGALPLQLGLAPHSGQRPPVLAQSQVLLFASHSRRPPARSLFPPLVVSGVADGRKDAPYVALTALSRAPLHRHPRTAPLNTPASAKPTCQEGHVVGVLRCGSPAVFTLTPLGGRVPSSCSRFCCSPQRLIAGGVRVTCAPHEPPVCILRINPWCILLVCDRACLPQRDGNRGCAYRRHCPRPEEATTAQPERRQCTHPH